MAGAPPLGLLCCFVRVQAKSRQHGGMRSRPCPQLSGGNTWPPQACRATRCAPPSAPHRPPGRPPSQALSRPPLPPYLDARLALHQVRLPGLCLVLKDARVLEHNVGHRAGCGASACSQEGVRHPTWASLLAGWSCAQYAGHLLSSYVYETSDALVSACITMSIAPCTAPCQPMLS